MDEAGRISFRVRYAETDQMGRAYHAWYLVWCEMGRSALLRDCGVSYAQLEKQGVFMPVRRAEVRYERPVRYDEVVDVRTSVLRRSPSRLVFVSEITNERGETAARGEVELAVTDASGKITRLPAEIMAALGAAGGEGEEP